MKYINAIELGGFQSHRHTDMQLVPGLNIITGPSDSGKTAIIRAIRWALYNEPAGDAMLNARIVESHGEAFVCIMFSDNHLIFRRRGKSINEYETGDQTYTGFGTSVPLEIIQAHGMPKAIFGDQEISLNINFQLDPPFLLSETSGAAARLLGKLAGTEEIDAAIKDINSELHRIRQQRTTLEALIESTERDLEQYDDLDRQCEQAANARALWTTSAAMTARADQLKKLLGVHTDLQAHQWTLRKQVVVLLEKTSVLAPLVKQAQTAASDHISLLGLNTRRVFVRYQQEQACGVMQHTRGLDRLYQLVDRAKTHHDLHQRLTAIHTEVRTVATVRTHWTRVLDGTSRVYEASAALDACTMLLGRMTSMKLRWNRFSVIYAASLAQKSVLQHTSNIQEAAQTIDAAKECLRTVGIFTNKQNEYEYCKHDAGTQRLKIADFSIKEATARHDFERYLSDLGICPLCGNQLDAKLIAKGA